MKVKDFIARLQKENPESELCFYVLGEDTQGRYVNVITGTCCPHGMFSSRKLRGSNYCFYCTPSETEKMPAICISLDFQLDK